MFIEIKQRNNRANPASYTFHPHLCRCRDYSGSVALQAVRSAISERDGFWIPNRATTAIMTGAFWSSSPDTCNRNDHFTGLLELPSLSLGALLSLWSIWSLHDAVEQVRTTQYRYPAVQVIFSIRANRCLIMGEFVIWYS